MLRGAEGLLREHAPTILCEVHCERERDDVPALLAGFDLVAVGGERRIGATPARRTIGA